MILATFGPSDSVDQSVVRVSSQLGRGPAAHRPIPDSGPVKGRQGYLIGWDSWEGGADPQLQLQSPAIVMPERRIAKQNIFKPPHHLTISPTSSQLGRTWDAKLQRGIPRAHMTAFWMLLQQRPFPPLLIPSRQLACSTDFGASSLPAAAKPDRQAQTDRISVAISCVHRTFKEQTWDLVMHIKCSPKESRRHDKGRCPEMFKLIEDSSGAVIMLLSYMLVCHGSHKMYRQL